MGMFTIIPDYISDMIDKKLNEAIAKCPDAEKDRAVLRRQVVDYFAIYGTVPDFSLGKKGAAP